MRDPGPECMFRNAKTSDNPGCSSWHVDMRDVPTICENVCLSEKTGNAPYLVKATLLTPSGHLRFRVAI